MIMNEMKQKAKFFFEHKTTIHIDTSNGSFYNGLIIELSDSLLIIHDRIVGETPILISEIKILEKFREVKV